jgi:hypothetical protein
MEIEAYIIKGMSTSLILGNDFADQYELLILRSEGQTFASARKVSWADQSQGHGESK